ncbi:Major fimbrium tip subunit FimD [anaerobic digester metagenome]
MKKINKISFAVILAFILAGVYSCMSDDYCDCDNAGTPESLTMSFSLSSSNKLRATRALPAEPGDHDGSFNENIVNTLDLFFYQDGVLKQHVPNNRLVIEEANPADPVKKKITVPITSGLHALIDAPNPVYDVYALANNTADLSMITIGSNLTALQNLLYATADFAGKGGFQPQTSFVMDGKLAGVNIKTTPNMGKAELKRAASKVRIRILEIQDTSGEGYVHDPATMEAPQARLVHFTGQSVLLDGGVYPATFPATQSDWKTTPWRDVSSPVGGEVGLPGNTTAAPFYAYSNDWNTDVTRETYVELKVPFSKGGVTRDYFYHVPVTPYMLTPPDPEAEPHLRKMERDFLYDIAVKINYVGVADNPPVTLQGNYTISDWSEQSVFAEIFMFHYLMVTPNNTVMPNVNTITLDFLSSVTPVNYKDLSVSYTYVNNNTGAETTVPITSGAQYATVTIDNNAKKITVTSAVPVNYIPKDIIFTAYTQPSASLTIEQKVVIRQLPATYFTSERGNISYQSPDGTLGSGLVNRYMYCITTLAPDVSSNYRWGFPPVDGNGNTLNNATVANMISPKFMMASQLGATLPMGDNSAKTQCQNYWEETTINGVKVTYDDWRLPTEAEIKYIDDLQRVGGVTEIMTGKYYWDAYSGNNAYKMRQDNSPPYYQGYATNTNAHVRCIRDVKD